LSLSPGNRWPPVSAAVVDTRYEYHHLFAIYVPIAVGVFAAIVLLTGFAVLRYRGRAPERAARWHENNGLEGGYAVLLAAVCVFLLYLTFTAEHRVDTVANRQRPALIVDVTAAKWEWSFAYPAYGFTQRSGTVGRQPLVVPAGRPVRFNLVSLDVIHAFWIPEVDYKHDLIPGSTQVSTLSFARPGSYQGQCAEFCGLRHADMVFPVLVLTPARFAAWAASGGKGPLPTGNATSSPTGNATSSPTGNATSSPTQAPRP
jgi:cytochrome c oxidase subunit 2